VQRSVLNFGCRSSRDRPSRRSIRAGSRPGEAAIVDHEPRILPNTLRVEALLSDDQIDQHNQVSFRITGQLWSQPVPLELLLHTDIDLETGRVDVRELAR
jgi:predicted component of type VI protein secretion system